METDNDDDVEKFQWTQLFGHIFRQDTLRFGQTNKNLKLTSRGGRVWPPSRKAVTKQIFSCVLETNKSASQIFLKARASVSYFLAKALRCHPVHSPVVVSEHRTSLCPFAHPTTAPPPPKSNPIPVEAGLAEIAQIFPFPTPVGIRPRTTAHQDPQRSQISSRMCSPRCR